jgi:D-serine deaminase-like pyridoxal phosphate-dependent protein
MHSPLNLDPLLNEPLDWKFRAFPATGGAIRIGDVPAQRWNLFESGFFFPALVLKEAALAHNVRTMAEFCAERGALLAPHGKTTMAPQLFERQLDAGAWAITAATMEHARIYRAFGVPRIFFASELARVDEARWVATELAADPGFDFLCYVDSPAGARRLSDVFRASTRKLRVVVELGTPGGRAGCRTSEGALALAREVAAYSGLELAGVACFEGILGADRSPNVVEAVDAFCGRLVDVAQAMLASDLAGSSDFVVSAGGSSFPDRVAERLLALARAEPRVSVVLRSGCYVTHDHGLYERVSPFASHAPNGAPRLVPALELWGSVVSRPEPELALLGFGKRDAPFDAGLPVPLVVRDASGSARAADGMTVVRLNDQHAYLALPASDPLAPGDLIACGVSHPCLAFDKWSLIPVVDGAYNVVEAVRTYF